MKRNPNAYLMAFLCATLVACAQLGLPTPQTMNERIAAAQGSVTELRRSATTLVQTGKISSSDATNVLKTTDAAAEGIAVARSISVTDPNAAQAKLQATVAVLTTLQAYLAARQTK